MSKLVRDDASGNSGAVTTSRSAARSLRINMNGRAAETINKRPVLGAVGGRRERIRSTSCVPLRPNQCGHPRALGQLKTEAGPVDSMGLSAGRTDPFSATARLRPIPVVCYCLGPRGRFMLIRKLRAALRDVVTAAGITARIVPHQFRHTYGTEMLRAGVGFAGVMKLLGHKSPHMTLEYLEITQQDLQREFHLARTHPNIWRHLGRLLCPPTSCGI